MNHDFQSGGPGSMTKRGSQQNRRGGQNSSEQRIIPSLRQEVTLHKSENAYKPMFQKDTTGDGEDKETKVTFYSFFSVLFAGLLFAAAVHIGTVHLFLFISVASLASQQ